MATTIYRLAEECLKALSGGDINLATNISMGEMRISIGQVANQLLKTEHFSINEKMMEKIDNGAVLGTYDDILVTSYETGKSKCKLPVKPLKLPRNMGIFSIFPKGQSDKEFIPLQMGQASLIQSQPLLNDLLGQVGYENYGLDIIFTKDLTLGGSVVPYVSMRLAIMDISQYGDYDILPILPEQEWQIKQEVIKLYSGVGVSDLLVDSLQKQQQNTPVPAQKQTQ